MTDVEKLISQYRQLLVDRAAIPHRPKVANRLYMKNREIYRVLRETEEGRSAISALMRDPLVFVRVTAATQALWWGSQESEEVLEAVKTSKDSGLSGVNAEYVLIGWRNGTLNLD